MLLLFHTVFTYTSNNCLLWPARFSPTNVCKSLGDFSIYKIIVPTENQTETSGLQASWSANHYTMGATGKHNAKFFSLYRTL